MTISDGLKSPVLLESTPIENGVRLLLEVPAGLAWFQGHFPAEAVLPGVAQTGWAIAFARERFGFATDPCKLEQVRFQQPVRPGAHIELELVRDRENPVLVGWRFSQAGEAVGRGRMVFAETP